MRITPISHASFKHGWYYHYRIHNPKLDFYSRVYNYDSLKDYLNEMLFNCPHGYFLNGPRGSKLKFKVDVDLEHVKDHEVSELAYYGLKINETRYKSNHSKVQVFMLENDKKSVAMEVPLWMHPEEFGKASSLMQVDYPLTGHIDILRIEDGTIWVWDYKPNAIKEKYATTQTFFYALMLSKRTGIPLDKFMCGYFDDKDAFIFKPELKLK